MSNVRQPLMTVSEAAAHLGVNPRTVHRWIASGRVHAAMRLPGRTGPVLLHPNDVHRLAAETKAAD
jgi:excisionase family DNA binding protein